jgi:hypothetical protein
MYFQDPDGKAMPLLITCAGCGSKLKIPDHLNGRKTKCPKCGNAVVVSASVVPTVDLADEEEQPERAAGHIQKAMSRQRARVEKEPEPPRSKRRVAEVEEEDQEEQPAARKRVKMEEAPSPGDDNPDAPRKRRKKRRRRRRLPDDSGQPDEGQETPAWPWWVAGGVGFFMMIMTMAALWIFSAPESPLKGYIIVFAIKMPASGVIFVIAMFIASAFGSFDFGQLHVTAVKAFFLLIPVNIVYLLPLGFYLPGLLAFVVWLAGLLALFRLDMWEAQFMIVINWILNWGVNWVLLMALAGMIMRGGMHDDRDLPTKPGKPGQQKVIDDRDDD